MSKIEALIQKLCPDGVDSVKVSLLCNRSRGVPITAGQMKELNKRGAPVRVFAAGNTKADVEYVDINPKAIVNTPSVIVKSRGNIGFEYYDKPFTHKSEMWAYSSKDSNVLNTKFLFYYFSSLAKQFHAKAKANSVKLPQLSIGDTDDFSIPLPPLAVQEEVVRILDKFSALEAELEAELEARKKQYEHYRDHLLNFNDNPNVKWVKLGEVFEIRNGYTPSKNNAAFWEGGTIPWFRMEDIRQNGRILSDAIQHITPAAIKGKGLFPANSIIIATTATIGEHAMIIADSLANQQFTNLKIRESLIDKLLPKFVFYYMFIIDEWCKQNVNEGNFASVDMKRFKRIDFPIPSLSEQGRIVGILDRFEALTTSLQEGLPAEISARRKQYEYYRDRLLSFGIKNEELKIKK